MKNNQISVNMIWLRGARRCCRRRRRCRRNGQLERKARNRYYAHTQTDTARHQNFAANKLINKNHNTEHQQ